MVEEVTLMAGRANPPLRAASSISRYFCGVGIGMEFESTKYPLPTRRQKPSAIF